MDSRQNKGGTKLPSIIWIKERETTWGRGGGDNFEVTGGGGTRKDTRKRKLTKKEVPLLTPRRT